MKRGWYTAAATGAAVALAGLALLVLAVAASLQLPPELQTGVVRGTVVVWTVPSPKRQS